MTHPFLNAFKRCHASPRYSPDKQPKFLPLIRRFFRLQHEARGACFKPRLDHTPCHPQPEQLSKRFLRCHRRSFSAGRQAPLSTGYSEEPNSCSRSQSASGINTEGLHESGNHRPAHMNLCSPASLLSRGQNCVFWHANIIKLLSKFLQTGLQCQFNIDVQ